MWWIFCDPDDVSALWAAVQLRAVCSEVTVVGSEELGSALGQELRLGEHAPEVRLELADGRVLDGRAARGVLNRLHSVPSSQVERAAHDDRAYAGAELAAWHLGWLHALPCPVINRPRPYGLAGRARSTAEWTALAARAGLPGARWDSAHPPTEPRWERPRAARLVLLDEQLTGDVVPPAVAAAARRLARLSGERLLGVDFEAADHGLRFLGASNLPDLRAGGARLVDLLRDALGMPAPRAASLSGASR